MSGILWYISEREREREMDGGLREVYCIVWEYGNMGIWGVSMGVGMGVGVEKRKAGR